jgi:ABC-type metal ion transport system substrate-binding protein
MQTKNILDNKKDLELTEEETNKLDKTFAESPIKNHPDFLHLRANYLTKQKKYKEAEGVFEEGLKIYSTNSCVVNHESLYLKDYIRLYKNMQ